MRNRTDTASIDVKSKEESEANQSPLKSGCNLRRDALLRLHRQSVLAVSGRDLLSAEYPTVPEATCGYSDYRIFAEGPLPRFSAVSKSEQAAMDGNQIEINHLFPEASSI
jgi:hypothetical protein